MAMIQHVVAVGVFTDRVQAQRAIDALRRAGFSDDEVGFLTRAEVADTGEQVAGDAASGAVGGGLIGGVLGAAAALLIPGFGPVLAGGILAAVLGGAAIGAAAGGLIASLVGMGISEADARFYQQELEAGRTIVTVKTESGYDEAVAILRQYGAYDATTRPGIINPPESLRP